MKCPQCGYEQSDANSTCDMCGVIFSKLSSTGTTEARPFSKPASPFSQDLQTDRMQRGMDAANRQITKKAWIYGGWGFGLAILTLIGTSPIWGNGLLRFFAGVPNLALGGMSTLVHEMGHALFGWLAGRASIPAFDLRYGGGVTMIPFQQKAAILWILHLAFIGGIVYFRRTICMVVALVLVGLLHAGYAYSGIDKPVILLMGHGTELLFAWLALHRALTGINVAHDLERLAYSVVGWFLVLHNLVFGWGLMTSVQARYWYGQAKGGGHWMDFSQIADNYLHVHLSLVAGLYVTACLSIPALAYLTFRWRDFLYNALASLTDPAP